MVPFSEFADLIWKFFEPSSALRRVTGQRVVYCFGVDAATALRLGAGTVSRTGRAATTIAANSVVAIGVSAQAGVET